MCLPNYIVAKLCQTERFFMHSATTEWRKIPFFKFPAVVLSIITVVHGDSLDILGKKCQSFF